MDISPIKSSGLGSKLENKNEINKNFTEQIDSLKKENNKLKHSVSEKDNEIKTLSAKLFGAVDASLHKEIAVFYIFYLNVDSYIVEATK